MLAVTGWWFILWLWVRLYADMLRQLFFTPLLGILGAANAALWFSGTSLGLFVSAVVVCIVVAVYIAIGMKWYSRIQKLCFWISVAALVVVFAFLLFGSQASFRSGLEREAAAMFGAAPNVYEATLPAGEAAGGITPMLGGSLGLIFRK